METRGPRSHSIMDEITAEQEEGKKDGSGSEGRQSLQRGDGTEVEHS